MSFRIAMNWKHVQKVALIGFENSHQHHSLLMDVIVRFQSERNKSVDPILSISALLLELIFIGDSVKLLFCYPITIIKPNWNSNKTFWNQGSLICINLHISWCISRYIPDIYYCNIKIFLHFRFFIHLIFIFKTLPCKIILIFLVKTSINETLNCCWLYHSVHKELLLILWQWLF